MDTREEYMHAKKVFIEKLDEEIRHKTFNVAQVTWNKLAEFCVMTVQGKSGQEAHESIQKAEDKTD